MGSQSFPNNKEALSLFHESFTHYIPPPRSQYYERHFKGQPYPERRKALSKEVM